MMLLVKSVLHFTKQHLACTEHPSFKNFGWGGGGGGGIDAPTYNTAISGLF